MARTKSSLMLTLIVTATLIATLSVPSAIANHGYVDRECDAGYFGLLVEVDAKQGHGMGAYAYAEGWVNWLIDGLEGPYTDEEEFPHQAQAKVEIRGSSLYPDLAREARGELEGWASGVEDAGAICVHNSPILNQSQFPEWVIVQLQAVGCSWTGGADSYGFSGELYYEDTEEVLYLKQNNDIIDLTSSPLFSASSQTVSALPFSAQSTGLEINAFGNDNLGCRHLVSEI